MNKMTKLAAAIALTTGAISAAPVMAGPEISGNVTLATDYTFRGVSQTSEKGAIQGGFDVAWDSGFYVGTWASNVDFGSEVTTELDLYFGYAFDLAENVSLDLSAIYFYYAGDESALNYEEYVATLSISNLSLGLVYSPDYLGDDNEDAFVYNVDYSLPLNDTTSLDFHVGYTDADEELFGTEDSYVDYSISVSHEIAGVSLGLAWVGTDADDDDELGDAADDRVVFSISKSL